MRLVRIGLILIRRDNQTKRERTFVCQKRVYAPIDTPLFVSGYKPCIRQFVERGAYRSAPIPGLFGNAFPTLQDRSKRITLIYGQYENFQDLYGLARQISESLIESNVRYGVCDVIGKSDSHKV